jgi:septum formation protein
MLESAGLAVVCVDPRVDEEALIEPDPTRRAGRLAAAKAEAVRLVHPDSWVLGADQVVHLDGEVFGKPKDPDDHLRRLRSMRGRVHELVTGWALRGPGDPGDGIVVTRMAVRADLTEQELAEYVATGEGAGCAGGYMAEARGAFLFEGVDGDWFNIVGLPLFEVLTALRARGWRFGGWR